ncbi:MAG: hypothetical protein Q8N23_05880 [Archangium sp.]|nr:hypothetical protein [Archangium sp.]MDP3152179.1 hypothetical protein [Archangium sp.]MDP3574939.1 hypothetical protein [Archangium sp.]
MISSLILLLVVAHSPDAGAPTAQQDDLIHLTRGRRVRFPAQNAGAAPAGTPWQVTRVTHAKGVRVKAKPGERILVAFRMNLRLREGLALLGWSSDRSMGMVLAQLVRDAPETLDRSDLLLEILQRRGRANVNADDETFNQTVEIPDSIASMYSGQLVGQWVDQALALEAETVTRIESLAKRSNLDADQAVDALITLHFAKTAASNSP